MLLKLLKLLSLWKGALEVDFSAPKLSMLILWLLQVRAEAEKELGGRSDRKNALWRSASTLDC